MELCSSIGKVTANAGQTDECHSLDENNGYVSTGAIYEALPMQNISDNLQRELDNKYKVSDNDFPKKRKKKELQ